MARIYREDSPQNGELWVTFPGGWHLPESFSKVAQSAGERPSETGFLSEIRLLWCWRSSARQQLLLGRSELRVAQHPALCNCESCCNWEVRSDPPAGGARGCGAQEAAQTAVAEPGRQPHPADRLGPAVAAQPPLRPRTSAVDWWETAPAVPTTTAVVAVARIIGLLRILSIRSSYGFD